MRQALTPDAGNRPVALPFSIPAPTGGWNARDPLASMPLSDAEIMDNWFPEATDVRNRQGSLTYASAVPGTQISTLLSYAKQATVQLLVAANTQIYTVTTVQTGGTINASSTIAAGPFTNDRWQYANIGTPGGSFLVAVNGADNNQIYDGSTWFSQTVTNGGSSPATVVASNVAVYNQRLFYLRANTLEFAYHDQVNAIGGTVNRVDLSGYMPLGGYLVGLDTWSHDGGSGPTDNICFISSRGEVAVFTGTNPSSASTWGLVGVYRMPAILGPRCTQKFGADLLIATEAGVFPISAVISGPIQQTQAVSDKIRNKINESVMLYRANFGWELTYFPAGHALILNVPRAENTTTDQYVMNTNTGSWCRFTGVIANCWTVYNNSLYLGSTTKVIKHWVNIGTSLGDDGSYINVDCKQASSAFGLPGRLKEFKLFRPQIASDGDMPLQMGIDTDFSVLVPQNVPTPVTVPYSLWDVSLWDTFYWADDPFPQPTWQGVGGLGTYGAVRIVGQLQTEQIRWNATDIILEPGEYV